MSGNTRFCLRVFAAFCVIYSVTWGGHYTSGDGAYKIAWAKAMLAGAPAVDPATHQPWSIYGIGHSLLAAVPLGLGAALRHATGLHLEPVLYTLMFVVQAALFLALVSAYLLPAYPPRQVAKLVALLGVATMWWPYSKLDFSEPLVLTFLFAGFLLARRGRIFWGFVAAGFAITIRTDALVLLAALAVYALAQQRGRRWAAMAAGVLPSFALWMSANYLRYGTIFDRGYSGQAFSNPLLVGIYGILFSPGKSIFLFSPPLILGLLGWNRFRRSEKQSADAWFFLSCFAAQLLIYAKWWDWSGDDSWGVRFMIPSVMLMAIPAIEMLQRRAAVLSVAFAGIFVQLLGVVISPLEYVVLVHRTAIFRRARYVEGYSRVDFDDVHFNPEYSQLTGHFLLIRNKLTRAPAGGPSAPDPKADLGTQLRLAADPAWDFIWIPRKNAQGGSSIMLHVPESWNVHHHPQAADRLQASHEAAAHAGGAGAGGALAWVAHHARSAGPDPGIAGVLWAQRPR
jgi:hypothetical protein